MKKDQAMLWTDKRLEELEKRIAEAYKKAESEITAKMQAYLDRFAKQDAVMVAKYKSGEISKQDLIEWRTNHFMMGKNWQAVKDTIAQDIANTDLISASIVNDALTDVYAYNANYAYYEMDRAMGMGSGLSFDLYDKKAVESLLSDNPDFMPHYEPKTPIIERWNRQHIQSEMLQGILQGESIPSIAKRMKTVVGMDKNSAIRNARTYTTSVENKAKLDRYSDAEELGIDIVKEWVATLDERTRESHRELDGEQVATDEPFSNGLMFPADPNGAPEEVYNCRCRIVSRIKGHNYDRSGRASKLEDMTYEEWKESKEKEQENQSEQPKEIEFTPASTIEEAEQYAKDHFVVDSKWAGEGSVSFKGMSLENANAINEELTRLFADNEVPKFRNIGMMNFRQNIWKDAKDAPMAYRNYGNGELFFNPNILKNGKSLDAYIEKGKEAFEYCVNNMDKFSGRQLELVKQYAEAGRQTVADSSDNPLKVMLDHEFGHHIDHQIILKDKDFAQVTRDGMEEYGARLSGYALHTRGEYVAESYSAYRNGLGDIDPALAEIFGGIEK